MAASHPLPLQGRAGIVTGGAQGIGRGIADCLLERGAQVAIFDTQPAGEAAESALAYQVDVRDPAAVRDGVARAHDAFGKLSFLVNNAGIRHYAPLLEYTEEQWRDTIDVDLSGAFFCAQAVVPRLLENGGGRIVNIGSIVGRIATANRVAYCSAKAGIEGLTRALAMELGPREITANTVAPGVTETELIQRYFGDEAATRRILEGTPMGRWGQPPDVARAVAFLVGPDADYVNGTTLYVDGGWAAGKDV
jgi:gluconate 5-dehydrogenase